MQAKLETELVFLSLPRVECVTAVLHRKGWSPARPSAPLPRCPFDRVLDVFKDAPARVIAGQGYPESTYA